MNAVAAHPIPDAALESDIAILGRKGSGKSTAARGLVERLLDAGRRVVMLDPLSQHWGLKARADGAPGFPVTVVGGDHADVALEIDKGAALGAFIAKSQGAFVIDTSDLRRPDVTAFCTPLLATLYALNRDPLWLVLDEADFYGPQAATREQTPLLYELDQIARRGRARGFRLWTVTQRPARLSKDLLSQAGSLLVMKLVAPHDRKAVQDWLDGALDVPADVVDILPSLKVGEGFFWNPDLGLAQRMQLPRCATLDTGFTPQAGAPLALANVDAQMLRQALGARVQPLSPAAIRAEAFAQGREAGAREERERLRRVLGEALAALGDAEKTPQDGPQADPATTPAADAPTAAPAPPAGPRSNDEAQRAILDGLNRPQRSIVERVLERGAMTPDRLANCAGMVGGSKAFRANLDALLGLNVLAYDRGVVTPTARLFPLGVNHR